MVTRLESYPFEKVLEGMRKAVSLTKTLTEDELLLFAKLALVEEYQKGDLMVVEEEDGNDLYIVGSGQAGVELKLSAGDSAGARIVKLGEGSVLGEVAFIDGQRRSASVRMLAPTIVFHFPANDVKALCGQNAVFGYKLMSSLALVMAHRIRNVNIELRSHLYA